MLSMYRPIFGTGNAVVLDRRFCVAKGITKIEAKCVYESALIKKRCYWPKGVPRELIDTHFTYKEVCDVETIEATTQMNNSLKIFCMKDPDYVMRIMEIWMALDELEGKKTRIDLICRSVTSYMKHFK